MNKIQHLADVLTREKIQHISLCCNWEEAVEIASKPLIQGRVITPIYVKNMIKSVYENGPYMVLADEFALMHARPGEGVNSLGLSMLSLDKPVDMEGVPVRLFLILATTDNEEHIQILSEITNLLVNEKFFNIFLSGDAQQILKLIQL